MKRIFLVLALIGLGLFVCFFSCDKSDQPSARQKSPEAATTNEQQKEYISPGGSACNCPNLASCSTDCLFSECCICWDPKKSEGACGCWFGIAKCKTALIGSNAPIKGNNGNEGIHGVKIFPSHFAAFLGFLDMENIKAGQLEESFSSLVSTAIGTDKSAVVKVNSDKFNEFADDFENFINSLDAHASAKVSAYIEKQSKQSGK